MWLSEGVENWTLSQLAILLIHSFGMLYLPWTMDCTSNATKYFSCDRTGLVNLFEHFFRVYCIHFRNKNVGRNKLTMFTGQSWFKWTLECASALFTFILVKSLLDSHSSTSFSGGKCPSSHSVQCSVQAKDPRTSLNFNRILSLDCI